VTSRSAEGEAKRREGPQQKRRPWAGASLEEVLRKKAPTVKKGRKIEKGKSQRGTAREARKPFVTGQKENEQTYNEQNQVRKVVAGCINFLGGGNNLKKP